MFIAHIIFLHFADSNNKNNNQHELTLNDAKKHLFYHVQYVFPGWKLYEQKHKFLFLLMVNNMFTRQCYDDLRCPWRRILLPSSGLLTMKPPNWNLSRLTRCTALAKPKKNQDFQRWGLNPDFTIEHEDLLNILSNKH